MAALTFPYPADRTQDDAVDDDIAGVIRRTFTPCVVADRSGCGVAFALNDEVRLLQRRYRHPHLVGASAGVGDKLVIAERAGRYHAVGTDLVARCVNELTVKGAESLFFCYHADLADLTRSALIETIEGIAKGCEQAVCALLGGDTTGTIEGAGRALAGFAVGMAEAERVPSASSVCRGDTVVGLASPGLHCSGCGEALKAFTRAKWPMSREIGETGVSLGDALSEPARIYARPVERLLRSYRVKRIVHAVSHVAEGGIPSALHQVLPDGCRAEIDSKAWDAPDIFAAIKNVGEIADAEMFRSFSMGLGMLIIVAPFYARAVVRKLRRFGETAFIIGDVKSGPREVVIA